MDLQSTKSRNSLLLTGQMRRITRFSTEGQLLSTHPRQRWAQADIRPFRDGYLFLSHQTNEPGDIDYLFRVYGSGFEQPTVTFGSTDQIADPYNKIETTMSVRRTKFLYLHGGGLVVCTVPV